MDVKVNFNEYVKVKLTPYGEQILKAQHDDLNLQIKRNGGEGLGEFKVNKDEDGYSKFQIWSLMNHFGMYMTLGSETPFEAEIIVTNGKEI